MACAPPRLSPLDRSAPSRPEPARRRREWVVRSGGWCARRTGALRPARRARGRAGGARRAPWLAPYDPLEQDIGAAAAAAGLAGRGGAHASCSAPITSAATSSSRIIFGSRIALLVGLAAVVIRACSAWASGSSPAISAGGWTTSSCGSPTSSSRFRSSSSRSRSSRRARAEPAQHHRRHRRVGGWVVYARVVRGRGALAPRARVRRRRRGAGQRRLARPRSATSSRTPSRPWLVVATLDMARVIVHRVGAVVPGAGRAAADADLGRHAGRRPRLHLDGMVARDVPGPRDPRHRARHQPLRRRPARHARPAPQALRSAAPGRDGALRPDVGPSRLAASSRLSGLPRARFAPSGHTGLGDIPGQRLRRSAPCRCG